MFPLLSSHLYPLLYLSISLVRLLVPVVEQWRLTYSSLLSYSLRLLYQVYTVIISLRSLSIDAYGSVMSDLLLFIWLFDLPFFVKVFVTIRYGEIYYPWRYVHVVKPRPERQNVNEEPSHQSIITIIKKTKIRLSTHINARWDLSNHKQHSSHVRGKWKA